MIYNCYLHYTFLATKKDHAKLEQPSANRIGEVEHSRRRPNADRHGTDSHGREYGFLAQYPEGVADGWEHGRLQTFRK